MMIQNLTTSEYYLDLGNNIVPDDPEHVNQITVKPLEKNVEIPPSGLFSVKDQLEKLLLSNVFKITEEDPYDVLIWRDVTGKPEFEGSGFQLIPKEHDFDVESTNRVIVTSGTYIVQGKDETIAVRATADVTIELPSPFDGRILSIKDEIGSADSFLITVDPGASTIEGWNTWVINAPYANLVIYSDGSAWYVK